MIKQNQWQKNIFHPNLAIIYQELINPRAYTGSPEGPQGLANPGREVQEACDGVGGRERGYRAVGRGVEKDAANNLRLRRSERHEND